ncbi:energy transducer TonB [Cellulophaga sp. Hel_I_12]|uniref:energy transducer TonB n=1 Tax=Cellulophaga sp. Hel_I_12 TaxID=1249972 RepID=UPI00068FEBE0|nr:energy transducer TonB [Cellulophaga sp. Hel_I_12]
MKKSTKSTATVHGNGLCSETPHVVSSKGSKQDANLRKNGFVHFQIGLILAMLLVYFGLEYAFNKKQPKLMTQQVEIPELVEFPPTDFVIEKEEVTKKVFQKATSLDEFIVVDDPVEVPNSLEYKNEPTKNSAPLDVDAIIVAPKDEDPNIVIPIAALEDAPIFPGCENVPKVERQTCFQAQMQKHIKKNFKYPEAAIATGTKGKVYVMFTIGKQGFIEDVQLKGPAEILEREAARIIDKLPQMTPGKQHLKPVKVSFSIPINFQLH